MKKILFVLSAVAVLFGAASCEKDNLGGNKETANPLNNITVTKSTDSKLAIDAETLTPAFEMGDVIFGWDSEGIAYAYTCTEVTEDAATFTRTSSGAPSADEGTLVNLVYAPGYEIEDIVDKTLDVNLAVQGETLPVVMHATGEVNAEGVCEVAFSNDVAIVDVKDAVLPDAVENEEYTVSFHGKNTSLKFALNEFGMLTVEPAVAGPISSSEKAKVSADSKISKKFAVPASGEATDVLIFANGDDGASYSFSAGSKTIEAGKYITAADKAFTPVPVAKIGSTEYYRLSKAVAAANDATDNVTIEMLNNVKSSKSVEINNAAKKKVTLDLGGCTVSSNFVVTTDFEVADATGEGVVEAKSKTIKMGSDGDFGVDATFTLNGGTIKTLDGDYAISADGIKNGDKPTVLVKKGTVIGNGGNAVRIKHATATFGDDTEGDIVMTASGNYVFWTSTSADVTINKGTYTLEKGAKALYYFGDGSSKVTFNDGTFTSNLGIFGFYKTTTNPAVTIVNGKFSWDNSVLFQTANTKSKVSGGYFTAAVPNANVEAGYKCVESTEVSGYSYKVVENLDKSVMEVGGTKYESVEAAIAAANAATTATLIKLLQDVNITSAIQFTTSAPLTLDLNGHKITAANTTTATCAIEMNTEGVNLTIEDNSEGAKGIIDQAFGDTAYTMSVNTGILTINSGTICNSSGTGTGRWAIKIIGEEGKAAPKVNINGGYIYGGRAVNIGSGVASIVPEVNITGGTIETKNTSTTGDFYQYGALCFLKDYYTCKMTGGTLVANSTSCFYTNRKEAGSTFIIGDPDDPTKIPYFWVNSAAGFSFRSGSGDASARLFVYNAYINNKTSKNSVFSKATGAEVHTLETPVTDAAGREYGYQVYVDAPSGD